MSVHSILNNTCRSSSCDKPQMVKARIRPLGSCQSGVNSWRRSEERRVGKECKSRGAPYHKKKNIALAGMLKPVISLIRYGGIGYSEVSNTARSIFVDVTTKLFFVRGHPTNASLFFFKQKTAYEIHS